MSKPTIIQYILLVDPSIVDLRDLFLREAGFKYPGAIKVVRLRPAGFGKLNPPMRLIPFSGYGVEKTFTNLDELRKELEDNYARKEDLSGLN